MEYKNKFKRFILASAFALSLAAYGQVEVFGQDAGLEPEPSQAVQVESVVSEVETPVEDIVESGTGESEEVSDDEVLEAEDPVEDTDEDPEQVVEEFVEDPVEDVEEDFTDFDDDLSGFEEVELTALGQGFSQNEASTRSMDTEELVIEENIKLDEETIYMANEKDLILPVDISAEEFAQLEWTFDGKPITEYMQWNMETGEWDSTTPLVTVSQIKDANGRLIVHVHFNTMFGSTDLQKRWPNNIRRTYPDYIGAHELKAVNPKTGKEIILPINYRPYANYMNYYEMVAATNESVANAAEDRYVDIEVIGQSTQGRDLRMGIIAESRSAVDYYLNNTTPLMLKDPAQFIELVKKGQIDYKVPIFFNNTHADEQPGVDIVRAAFDTFAREDKVTFDTKDEEGNLVTKTLSIPEILKKAILLFNFTENPDGVVMNTRAGAEGFDLNRDSSYQTLPETRAVVEQMNKYNPITFMDFHGFVSDFLIEPCTPPHDPNFEMDLLFPNLLGHAKAMGEAGIANSSYDHFIIPAEVWEDGWDDAFSGYTGVYAVYQGILGHTIEIPEMNDQSFYAGYYAALGGIDHVLNNRDKLWLDKLEIFRRGVEKREEKATEQYFVDAEGNVVGRRKGENGNFFPDYFVIPMSLDRQKNPAAAFEIIEYLRRNGVEVSELKEDVEGYEKGDLVIDMAQAKRGYANHVLYSGNNESSFAAMYAELVVNFPQMRGFDCEPIFNKSKEVKDDIFYNLLGEVTHTQAPRTAANHLPYYFVKNNSLTATQAVNEAIAKGYEVYSTEDGFYLKKSDYEELLKKYALVAEGVCGEPKGQVIKPVKVYAPGNPNAGLGFPSNSNVYWVLKEMGFEVVDNFEDADYLVVDSSDFDPELLGKKPTILLGGEALEALVQSGKLAGFEIGVEDLSYEGLLKAIINKDSDWASGFAGEDLIYSNTGTWITALPEGFVPIVKVAEGDFFISGWWPGNEEVASKIMAAEGKLGGNHSSYSLEPQLINVILSTSTAGFPMP